MDPKQQQQTAATTELTGDQAPCSKGMDNDEELRNNFPSRKKKRP